MKAVLLSVRWAGRTRQLGLERAASAPRDRAEVLAENVTLRDTVEFLIERLACAERRLRAGGIRRPYSVAERLRIIWCVEYLGITRRQIPKRLGVARSTVWRWLHRLQDGVGLCGQQCRASGQRTSEALARLVWEMHRANLSLT
jgi:transposase-like protein